MATRQPKPLPGAEPRGTLGLGAATKIYVVPAEEG